MQKNLKNKKICILGLSFKKNTDDLRESSSIPICHKLLVEGAVLQIFDPLANMDRLVMEFEYQGLWQNEYAERISMQPSAMEAASGTHAIVLLTEWDVFAEYDYA
jgi:UDPglucose 6-dehydrogenase